MNVALSEIRRRASIGIQCVCGFPDEVCGVNPVWNGMPVRSKFQVVHEETVNGLVLTKSPRY